MTFDKAYFDAGVSRIGTNCVKWDGMLEENKDPDMIPMWVADMDFPSPPAVAQALAKVAAQGTWGYTHAGEKDSRALSDYWKRRHQVAVDPQSVLVLPCVVSGLRMCVRALTEPNDGVLIFTPIYGPFYAAITESGRKVVASPLERDEKGRYTLNLADAEGKLASREAKMVMMCSPHNPCGRAWSEKELADVAALCYKYGVPLACDEIHADFVYQPAEHHCMLDAPHAREFAVMLCAASKTYNVAGLQQSAIVCENEKMRERIRREITACGVTSGNVFALAATRAAYTDCDEWLDGLKAYLMENRDFVMQYAKENFPKVVVTPLEATYLMWLDCRALGLEQEELMRRLLDAHVRVNDGLVFGEGGRGFIRLNIGCPRAQLEAALERMKTVLG